MYWSENRIFEIILKNNKLKNLELAKQAGTVWIGAAMFGGSRSYTYGDKSNFDFENWEGGKYLSNLYSSYFL